MKYFIISVFVVFTTFAYGQSIHSLNLKQADSLFLQNNYLLLAQKYNVSATQAQMIQQKLWPNPIISAELNAFNPNSRKYLDVGPQGQRIFAIQQLVEIAGQRNKRAKIAFYNAQLSEADFYDLLRTLKFQLHSSFYSVYFTSKTIEIYKQQLNLLQEIIGAFETQQGKGNISLKELIRLKSLEFQLKNDLLEQQFRAIEEEKNLKLLTGRADSIVPIVEESRLPEIKTEGLIAAQLIDKALENRPDVKISELLLSIEKTNYRLQKSMSVPNLSLGLVYDRLGSAFNNYVGISTSMDLPVWNRNQGNIKTSKYLVETRKNELTHKHLEVESEVKASLNKAKLAENTLKGLEDAFSGEIETLNKGVLMNFQKRNLSLIEFVDFFESYNESIKQINRLKAERILALEEVNYNIGTEIFR